MIADDGRRRARNLMHLHLMRRLVERGVPLDYADIVALEQRIERMRASFERPGIARYRLRLKYGRSSRVRVVYDVEYRCLLTAWMRPATRYTGGGTA